MLIDNLNFTKHRVKFDNIKLQVVILISKQNS